jgi:Brp/Blh family beta-carotene 15,15'-monooxygenase
MWSINPYPPEAAGRGILGRSLSHLRWRDVLHGRQWPTPAQARKAHRTTFLAIAAVTLVAAALGARLDILDLPLLAALIILVLGVPHGAFDAALADRRFRLDSSRRLALFILGYLMIAAAVAAVWFALPAAALCAFLAYSAAHFADDWAEEVEALPRMMVGAAIVSLPAVTHPEQVAVIFGWMTSADIAETVTAGLRVVGIIATNAAIAIVVAIGVRTPLVALEIAAVLALAAILPPLTFFVLYFCLLHSVRHTFDAHERLRPPSLVSFARSALPYALAAMAGTIASGLLLFRLEPGEALLTAVFIALAALTVPHMLLETMLGKSPRKLG